MASPGTSNPRLKLKKPLDVWSTREKLCLASAVFKIGDQNWVSVSRAIKPYAEPGRPPEWFHQKNCLLQYYDLMEQLEQPKRKRGGDRSESDTPSLQIMRKMTIERSEQLKKEILEMQQIFKQLKSDVESIKAGLWDERIEDVWQEIKEQQRKEELQQKIEVKVEDDYDESKISVTEISDIATPVGDIDDSTQDSVGDISVLTDEECTQSGSSIFSTLASIVPAVSATEIKLQSASHLLTLLKSDVKTATELQRLKHEQEQGQQQEQILQQPHSQGIKSFLSPTQKSLLKIPITQDDPLTTLPSNTAPTLSRLLSTAKGQAQLTIIESMANSSDGNFNASTDRPLEPDTTNILEETVIEDTGKCDLTDTHQCSGIQRGTMEPNNVASFAHEIEDETEIERNEVTVKDDRHQNGDELVQVDSKDLIESLDTVKEELDKDSQDGDENTSIKRNAENLVCEAELTESSVKDEPLSPTSSISSKFSDAGSKRGSKIKGRPRSARLSGVSTRKSFHTDDDRKDEGSSQLSDGELSEDDMRDVDDILTVQMASVNASSVLSESFPNSPASLSICSDTEEEKSFKQWKKSIMLVWRAAATHKYANVFLHPVTDEIAPGYHTVVLRPMDLSTIKKNVETGFIRSTVDFQHDMMLMFTNAVMYNSSDHNVFKMAKEMYDDVMQHIEMMIQTSDAKNLRQSRRTDASDKEDDAKKRKFSSDQSEGGGKTKKRKTRVDDILIN